MPPRSGSTRPVKHSSSGPGSLGDPTVASHRLGPAVGAGDAAQAVVPAGAWQTARPLGAWTLVGCIVAPAFEFDGWELAPEGWEPPI